LNITIVTDDSGAKLPEIDRYRDKIGKGTELSKDQGLVRLLSDNGLDIPADDMENESTYRRVLSEYIRPARLMFAGMFSEVRVFSDGLKKDHAVKLLIISGRYGLISENEEIIPYQHHISDRKEMERLDLRTGLFDKLIDGVSGSDIAMFFLPGNLLSYLMERGLLNNINSTKVIAVTSSRFRDELLDSGHFFLLRRGVARIGKDNAERIKETIQNRGE